MTNDRLPINSQFVIATMKRPVIWHRTEDEAWLMNPPLRYILSASNIPAVNEHIEALSDLKGQTYLNPLQAGQSLASARLLIERNRDRGYGDLLFLTGPMDFFMHASGGQVKIDIYGLADRTQVLTNHPSLHLGTAMHGPLQYENLMHYNYQWFVDTVTECNEEGDQLNVYDALYKQLGFNPESIEPRFKRPSVMLTNEDTLSLDQFFQHIWLNKKVDFRRVGYYVVAPFSASSLRSMNYSNWLAIIKELAGRRPVIVVGAAQHKMPDMDMSVGEFQQTLMKMNNIINAIGATPVRTLMALVQKAVCCVTLDSGPLYIAQALRTPAISIWGSHDPGVRIGYDPDYMELAIWNQPQCRFSPCFAYANFPAHKCPAGEHQPCCEVLASVGPEQVLEKLDKVESRNVTLKPFSTKA